MTRKRSAALRHHLSRKARRDKAAARAALIPSAAEVEAMRVALARRLQRLADAAARDRRDRARAATVRTGIDWPHPLPLQAYSFTPPGHIPHCRCLEHEIAQREAGVESPVRSFAPCNIPLNAVAIACLP